MLFKLNYIKWKKYKYKELIITLAMPEMMMVLFFTGDLSFCLADWWSCLMAASATGSVPLSINSSVSEEDRALLTVPPNIDTCSETRRSPSLGLLTTAFWAGSEEARTSHCSFIHVKDFQNIHFCQIMKMTELSCQLTSI